jgi:hypothetical protein
MGAGDHSSTDEGLHRSLLRRIPFSQALLDGRRYRRRWPPARPVRNGPHRILRQSLRIQNQSHRPIAQNRCPAHYLHMPVEAA